MDSRLGAFVCVVTCDDFVDADESDDFEAMQTRRGRLLLACNTRVDNIRIAILSTVAI